MAIAQPAPIAIEIPAKFAVKYEHARPSQCYIVRRPASGRVTATIDGPGRWDVCVGMSMCPTDCFDSGMRTANAEPLQGGDFYYVMLVSKDPGTTGTLSIFETGKPVTPTVAGTDLRGSWRWSCCRGRHSGTFQITGQNADGTFTGRFGDTANDGRSPISGRIIAANVEFTRRIVAAGQDQRWKAQLSANSGVTRMINGSWSGYAFVAGQSDFQAERIGSGTSTPPQPAASGIVGRWNWTCCKGTSSGTFIVQQQDAQGRIRGVFGNSPSDGATPFEGTYSGGQLVFTRMLTGNIAGQRQVWRAQVTGSGSSLRTTNGQWSGYGAVAGYTDFQATFSGAR